MATFSFVQPIKSGGGSGGATSYSLLLNRIEQIKQLYTDFNGNVIDKAYYDLINQEYQKALDSGAYTLNQKGDISNALLKIQKDYRGWELKSNKLYNASKTSIESDLEDDWQTVWKNNVKNLDVPAMSDDMLTSIEIAKGQLMEFKSILEEETADTDKIEIIDDVLETLADKETMWRGVQTNPNRYGLVFDTDSQGVHNIQVKRLNDIPSGYHKLPEVNYGGVSVFANTSGEKDDAGNEYINFGNGVWKGNSSLGFVYDADASGSDTFDTKSVRNIPFLNYQAGTIFKKPDGGYYVFDGDGQYTEYLNEDLLRRDGFTSENARTVTEAESEKIKRQFNVNLIDREISTKTKQTEIQNKLQGVWNDIYNQLNPTFKENYGAEAGARATKEIPSYFKPLVSDTFQALQKNPFDKAGIGSGIYTEALKGGLKTVKENLPQALAKATGVQSIANTAKQIFSGFFGKDK